MAKTFAVKIKDSGRKNYAVGTLHDTGNAYGNKAQADYYRGKVARANLDEDKRVLRNALQQQSVSRVGGLKSTTKQSLRKSSRQRVLRSK